MKNNRVRCRKCGIINNRKRKVCRCCGASLHHHHKWYFIASSIICVGIIIACYFAARNKSENSLIANAFPTPSASSATTELSVEQQDNSSKNNETAQDDTSDSRYGNYYYFTFRNGIKFGMTKDDIIAIEGIPDWDGTEEDRAMLAYVTTVSGLDAFLYYCLDYEGCLAQIMYIFTETHSNENLYISDFDEIEYSLSRKYGEQKIEYTWLDDYYKDDKSEWGFAIALGDMQMRTSRDYYNETDNNADNFVDGVDIIHTISGDNFDITHLLIYNTWYGTLSTLINEGINDYNDIQMKYI